MVRSRNDYRREISNGRRNLRDSLGSIDENDFRASSLISEYHLPRNLGGSVILGENNPF